VSPVFIHIKRLRALCFHMLHNGFVRWMRPHNTSLLLGTVADLAKGRTQLLVENALLRVPLIVLRRQIKRPACRKTDKFLLVRAARGWFEHGSRRSSLCSRRPCFVGIESSSACSPKHKSKADARQPKLSTETIALIKDMAMNNRLWGAERIRGELLKLDIRVCKRAIQRYMRHVRFKRPGGQNWATFLQNHAADIWAGDFLQITDLFFRSLFVFFNTLVELSQSDPCGSHESSYRCMGRTTAARGYAVWAST
jgi:putative transposase